MQIKYTLAQIESTHVTWLPSIFQQTVKKNTVNVLHLAMYSFQRLWRLNPSIKSSTQLNVHLFRIEEVDTNQPPNQFPRYIAENLKAPKYRAR